MNLQDQMNPGTTSSVALNNTSNLATVPRFIPVGHHVQYTKQGILKLKSETFSFSPVPLMIFVVYNGADQRELLQEGIL